MKSRSVLAILLLVTLPSFGMWVPFGKKASKKPPTKEERLKTWQTTFTNAANGKLTPTEIDTFLEHGNKLDTAYSLEGYNLLQTAVVNNKPEAVMKILDKGARINAPSQKNITGGLTALHLAIKDNLKDIAELLLSRHAQVNDYDNITKTTPLHIAVQNNNPETTALLIKYKADIAAKDIYGNTTLHTAAYYSSPQIVKMLLDAYKDHLNLINPARNTPLHIAARYDKANNVAILLRYHAETNIENASKRTARQEAKYYKSHNALKAFAQHDLLTAIKKNDNRADPFWENLIQQGADVNFHDPNQQGETPLMVAIQSHNSNVLPILVQKGALVNEKDNDGTTPLHVAAAHGSQDEIATLIKLGANVNIRDNSGQTPLFKAVIAKNENNIAYLLLNGADATIQDNQNLMPSDYALGDATILTLLQPPTAPQPPTPVVEAPQKEERVEETPELLQRAPTPLQVEQQQPEETLPVEQRAETLVPVSPEIQTIIEPQRTPAPLPWLRVKTPQQEPKLIIGGTRSRGGFSVPGETVQRIEISEEEHREEEQELQRELRKKPFWWITAGVLGTLAATYFGYQQLQEKKVSRYLTKDGLYLQLLDAFEHKDYAHAYRLIKANPQALRELSTDLTTKNDIEKLIDHERILLLKKSRDIARSYDPFKKLLQPDVSAQLKILIDLAHSLEYPEGKH